MSRLDVGTERSLPQILRRMIAPAIFVGALFVVLWMRAPERAAEPATLTLSGSALGTTYTVKLVEGVAPSEEVRARSLEIVEEELAVVDRTMSTWRDDSELSRFNEHGDEPFEASRALLDVMAAAIEIGERSGGAFDVTVGPLVDAWGFGSRVGLGSPPDERIRELLEATGQESLEVDRDAGTLRKAMAALRSDLSAIAKGYAVDRVAEALAKTGWTSFMVEVGGEVVARGTTADGTAWRIGIEVPDPARRAVHSVVALDEEALATSGNYRNFRLENGLVVSHIIDPRTGRPVTHSLASVSVVAGSCMKADAWATALSVLGPEEGFEVAQREGLAALFITRGESGELEERSTPAFARYRAVESAGGVTG